jgi:hypothetical protein
MMDDIELGPSWDFLKNLPPCRLCDKPIESGWITSDGVHFECAQQYPDAMFG